MPRSFNKHSLPNKFPIFIYFLSSTSLVNGHILLSIPKRDVLATLSCLSPFFFPAALDSFSNFLRRRLFARIDLSPIALASHYPGDISITIFGNRSRSRLHYMLY